MSEPTDSTTLTSGDDEWLAAPRADDLDSAAPGTPAPAATSRRTLAVRAGLVAAGAVVGGIVVTSMHHGSSPSASPTSFVVPSGQAGPLGAAPGGQQGGFGGLDGEQRVAGALVSTGSSTVTIRTANGTATYAVTSTSEIVRDGQPVGLSALQPGDPVFLHVYPSGSSARLTVERLFAGSSTDSGH